MSRAVLVVALVAVLVLSAYAGVLRWRLVRTRRQRDEQRVWADRYAEALTVAAHAADLDENARYWPTEHAYPASPRDRKRPPS